MGPAAGTGTSGRIVCGIDGSASSLEALAWAARLPTARDGKVEVRPLLQVASAATGTGAGS